MADQLTIVMSAEEAKLWQSITSTVTKMAGMERGFQKIATEARNAAKATAELDREAKKVFEQTRSPMEQHEARHARLNEMLRRGKIDQETYNRAVRQTGQHLHDSHGMLDMWVMGLKGYAAGLLGLGGAMAVFRGEMENIAKVRRDAAEATSRYATSERDWLRNLQETPERTAAARARLQEISKRTGVAPSALAQTASGVMSSIGLAPEELGWQAIEQAARYIPEDVEKQKALAIGSMDLARVMGSKDIRHPMGMLARVSKASHIFDWEKIAKYGAPAMTGAMMAGATPEEAGALFSAVTYGRSDWTGRLSRHLTMELPQQLREYLPEKTGDAPIYRNIMGQMVKLGDRPGTGLKTLGERLEYLWSHPEEAAKFRAFMTPDALADPTVRELIGMTPPAAGARSLAEQYREFKKMMPTEAGATEYWEELNRNIAQVPTQRTEDASRRFAAIKERGKVAREGAARAGITYRDVPAILEDTGYPWLKSKMLGLGMNVSTEEGAMDIGIRALEVRKEQLESGWTQTAIGFRPAWQGEKDQLPLLEDSLEVLRQMREETRKQTTILGEVKSELEKTGRKQNVSGSAATNVHGE